MSGDEYPKLDFGLLEEDLFQFICEIDEVHFLSIGRVYKHMGKLVKVEVASNESNLNYQENYLIQCVKDKIKHLDKDKYTLREYKVIKEVLSELLEQMES